MPISQVQTLSNFFNDLEGSIVTLIEEISMTNERAQEMISSFTIANNMERYSEEYVNAMIDTMYISQDGDVYFGDIKITEEKLEKSKSFLDL